METTRPREMEKMSRPLYDPDPIRAVVPDPNPLRPRGIGAVLSQATPQLFTPLEVTSAPTCNGDGGGMLHREGEVGPVIRRPSAATRVSSYRGRRPRDHVAPSIGRSDKKGPWPKTQSGVIVSALHGCWHRVVISRR